MRKLIDHYKIKMPNLWVVHDDLDIALGEYKIQKTKGPKEHKGVKSIENFVGNKNFWRVRIGIENRFKNQILGEDYVLQDFTNKEVEIINSVIDKIIGELIDKLKLC